MFEDTKEVIWSGKSKKKKKDRQYNGKKKKGIKINNDFQNITQKPKDWATRTLPNPEVNPGAPEELEEMHLFIVFNDILSLKLCHVIDTQKCEIPGFYG